ncbi:hypothetical protein K491DRAFT_172517 [Lophiostoma macrostomum CBS 122681]|uniref:Uncharacterized protein n=1 Tax=Lophiostoma macrostomum CBS 122681 TaxID=1314788 RepID=A0A6A6SQ89_9PLEO|nr:hypothetical protein K491DRAFT_172517 [Lophiostoma macrostomum CBS 122681]
MHHPISRSWYTTRSTPPLPLLKPHHPSRFVLARQTIVPDPNSWDWSRPSAIVLLVFLALISILVLYFMLVLATGRDNLLRRRRPRDADSDVEAAITFPPLSQKAGSGEGAGQEHKSFAQRYLHGLRAYKKPALPNIPMSERANVQRKSMQDVPLTPPAPVLHRKPVHSKYSVEYFQNYRRNNANANVDQGKGKGKKAKSPPKMEEYVSPANPFYTMHLQRQRTGKIVADNPYQ